MSRYLIERIEPMRNVTLHSRVQISTLEGAERLEEVRYRHLDDGIEARMSTRHLFLFTGAAPNTAWLKGCNVSVDDKGFVLTGTHVPEGGTTYTLPLQTSVNGVFAIGDVRSGSIKRVAAAVGEGAAAIAQIHTHLQAL
jgi:thioredoxin reductase (NADPH)